MKITINNLTGESRNEAVNIFTDAFTDDPLFILAFPDKERRKYMTRLMYEFVVFDMVTELNLKLKGAYADGEPAGCIIYSTPESHEWNDRIMEAVYRMREKANDERINLVGEFAMLNKFEPEVKFCYGNELAAKKSFRRRGIGGTLIEDMIGDCRKFPGVKGILLDTANGENISLYEKFGWVLKYTADFYSIKKYFLWKEF